MLLALMMATSFLEHFYTWLIIQRSFFFHSCLPLLITVPPSNSNYKRPILRLLSPIFIPYSLWVFFLCNNSLNPITSLNIPLGSLLPMLFHLFSVIIIIIHYHSVIIAITHGCASQLLSLSPSIILL